MIMRCVMLQYLVSHNYYAYLFRPARVYVYYVHEIVLKTGSSDNAIQVLSLA